MRKFNVTVNGKSYVVDVEEVGSDGQVTPVISTVAAAPAPVAKPVKVVILEAMKMENDINAPADGTITYVVKKGDNVDTGAVLAYIK